MSSITSDTSKQYSDSSKLAARARLYTEFDVSPAPWFPWVMDQLPLRSGSKVLDIGCGPAWFWAASEGHFPRGIELTLADQSPGMVAEALERCKALGFEYLAGDTANIIDLPYADNSFDAVVAMHMLYHVADQKRAIAELHRVLKPGGVLAVTTNGANNMKALYQLTTTLGSDPIDPSATTFGFERAESLLKAEFGNAMKAAYPGRLRVTDPEVVFLALTSYPPGDRASETELEAFRDAIAAAFEGGGGVLNVEKDVALFLSRKSSL